MARRQPRGSRRALTYNVQDGAASERVLPPDPGHVHASSSFAGVGPAERVIISPGGTPGPFRPASGAAARRHWRTVPQSGGSAAALRRYSAPASGATACDGCDGTAKPRQACRSLKIQASGSSAHPRTGLGTSNSGRPLPTPLPQYSGQSGLSRVSPCSGSPSAPRSSRQPSAKASLMPSATLPMTVTPRTGLRRQCLAQIQAQASEPILGPRQHSRGFICRRMLLRAQKSARLRYVS